MSEFQSLKELRSSLPAPRAAGRASARAALLERVAAESRAEAAAANSDARRRRLRRLGFGSALALPLAVGIAALVIAVGLRSAGGPVVRAEVASAAELTRIARRFPRIQIAGPWQILSTEGTGDQGRTKYVWQDETQGFGASEQIHRTEVRWHSSSQRAREAELFSKGYEPAAEDQLTVRRPASSGPLTFRFTPMQFTVLTPPLGAGVGDTVVLWTEGNRAFELRATSSVYLAFRLAERVELLTQREWLAALKPGGGSYLAETVGGVVKVEKVKVGERPDGSPIFETRGWIKGPPGSGTRLVPDFETPAPPTIYRAGKRVRIVVVEPPQ